MRGGGHGHGHGHGRHGLRRFFAHGDLRLVVLHLIGEKPRHGYELIKAIEESVSGAYSPSPGTIYPTLTMLEDQGYVRVSDGLPAGAWMEGDDGSWALRITPFDFSEEGVRQAEEGARDQHGEREEPEYEEEEDEPPVEERGR